MAVNWVHLNHHRAGSEVAYHSHAATEVVAYLAGVGHIVINGQRYEYGTGTFTVAPTGVRHNLITRTPTDSLCMLISGGQLEHHQGVWQDRTGQIAETSKWLLEELENRAPGFRQIGDSLGDVIVGLVRRVTNATAEVSRERATVNRAINLIDAGHGLTTVAQIARELCVSTSHLRHMFQRHAPVSAMQFILHARIRHAKGPILATDATLGEIAASCGFETSHHFSRLFKRMTGVSPSAYRRCGGKPESRPREETTYWDGNA